MNKLCYRLVFNKTRGMLMAVQESVRSRGKGPGETRRAGGVVAVDEPPALCRLAVLLAAAFGGALASGAALAQVRADPNAPGQQQATVLRAGNGVLQVNVQTPSAAGVSRNVYSQFDVPTSGVILNNGRTDAQTQLGGWVQANPWMKNGSARVILNEVNAANPSRLQGYIEVAGQRAETVIANPAGIVVDGGGFINVSRATLTTGTPILRDGQLRGFNVERGHIAIDGTGLNAAKADYTALISRSVQLNAGLWAKQLEVVTGVNEVTVDDGAGRAVVVGRMTQDSAGAPRHALDVAQLGGMYANQIWVVGTEHGVGVRNAGEIGAGAGELVVTSSGRLENTGSLAAAGTLQLHARAIDNTGGALQAPRLDLAADNIVNAKGRMVQTGPTALVISAQQVSNAAGTLGEQAQPATAAPAQPPSTGAPGQPQPPRDTPATGSDTPAAPVPVGVPTSPAAPAAPQLDGRIHAGLLNNDGGLVTASGSIAVSAGAFANLGGQAYLGALNVAGPAFDNSGGTLRVMRDLHAAVDRLSNRHGTLLVGGRADVGAGGIDNRAGLLQAGHLTLGATGQLDNADGTLRQTGSATALLRVGGVLGQDGGTIESASALGLSAGSIAGVKSVLNVAGDLDLSSGDTSAAQGDWRVNGAARIATGKLDTSAATVSVAGTLALAASDWGNTGGRLSVGSAAQLQVAGSLDNTNGLLQSGTAMQIAATGTLSNRAGTVETLGAHATLDVAAAVIDNTAGRLVNSGDDASRVAARTIVNSGLIGGNGMLAIDADTLANATAGRIVAAGDMALSVSGLLANAGKVTSGGNLAVTGRHAVLENTGSMVADANLTIDNGVIENRGVIATASGSGGQLTVRTGRFANLGGTVQADGDTDIKVAGDASNIDGDLRAGGRLTLAAGGDLTNLRGDIVGANGIDLQARNIANLAGTIVGTGNAASRIAADNNIDNQGRIDAGGPLALYARTLDNGAKAVVSAQGPLTLAVREYMHNHGALGSGAALTWVERGAVLTNQGSIAAAGPMLLDLRGIDNQAGAIQTIGSDLSVTAGWLDNAAGRIMSGGNAGFTIQGKLNNAGGVLQAAHHLNASVGAALSNTSGIIETLQGDASLALRAGSIDNTGGRMVNAGTGAMHVAADQHIANSGLIGGNGQVLVAARTLESSGTISALGNMTLGVSESLKNTGTISAAGQLASDQAGSALRNTGNIVAGAAMSLRLDSIDNAGGRIATAQGSGAGVTLAARQIGNQAGAIMSDGSAALSATGALDNTGGLLQAKAHLQVTAGAMFDNTRGQVEALSAASTLRVQAGAVRNEAGRIVNAGNGNTAVYAATTLENSGVIAGKGALHVDARDAVNSAAGTIAAGGGLTLAIHDSFDNAGAVSSRGPLAMDEANLALKNSGSIVSDASLSLRAGAVDNNGGRIATASGSGASLALQAASLSNRGGRVMADAALVLGVDGALDNTGGIFQASSALRANAGATLTNDGGVIEATGAAAQLQVQAGAIGNAGGRIVNVGTGATTVHGAGTVTNSGLIAGNGVLELSAGSLLNESAGTIASSRGMQMTIGSTLDNRGSINSGATLDIAAKDASVRNRGLVVASGELSVRAATLDNDGGRVATAQGSGAGIDLDAGSISNRGGILLSDADARVNSAVDIDNRQGTLQAATSLALTAGGEVRNDAGLVETLAPNATLALQAASLDNGSGRIVNVGSGDTSLNAGTISNKGLIAGNGAVGVNVGTLDNGTGGTVAAGRSLTMSASTAINNAGMLSSHDDLLVKAGGATFRNSGQVVSGANATLATNNFDNGGGTIGVKGTLMLDTADFANAGGTIIVSGSGAITASGNLDNRLGTVRTGGALAIDTAGSLANHGGSIEAGGATLDVNAASIDNGNGRLVNAGMGDTRIVAQTAIVNGGTLAGNGKVSLRADSLRNDAGGTVGAGGALDLHLARALDNAGTISSAGTLTMQEAAARIDNIGSIGAGGRIVLDAASIVNDGGKIATAAQADIVLASAAQLSNRSGSIAAGGNALIQAAGALDNTAGAIEALGANSALALQAAAITNTGRIVNSGAGTSTITSLGAIANDGLIGGNGTLDLSASTLRNGTAGTIAAKGALELAVRERLDNAGTISSNGTLRFAQAGAQFNNSGRIGAGGAIDIRAAAIQNDGGRLYTASGTGATIALQAGSVSNLGGSVAADGRLDVQSAGALANHAGMLHGGTGLNLDAGGALTNGSGAIEAGTGTLNVQAQAITSSGRIVNGGTGSATVTSDTGIVNSGMIAGNGALAVHAQTLRNDAGGQIAAGAGLLLGVRSSLSNAASISSAGTLTFDQRGASFTNSGQVDAGGAMLLAAAAFNNDGGRISTVKGSGASLVLTAPSLSNRNGAILADGSATLTFTGAADNRLGTLQAGTGLVLSAGGAVANDGGAIETVGAAGTLRIDAAAIDNGGGRIVNLGSGDTVLASSTVIANGGTIAAKGKLLLSGQELQNQASGTIASGSDMTLAIASQWRNAGKVNSGGTLTFNQADAVLTNSGEVLAGGNAVINARQVDNSGGRLGTGNGSGADLALTTQQLSNQGGRIATDRDLAVRTGTMAGTGELFGGRDLALAMDGNYTHAAGTQQFASNRDLSLSVTGDITNTAAFEAARNLSLSGRQIVNQAGASIGAQGVTLKATGNLDNAGEINGAATLDIAAANVGNTGGIVGGAVTLATGNLNNTGGAALVGATSSLNLGVSGTLNNTTGATLYSGGSLSIGNGAGGATALVNNNSSTIEARGDLALNAGTLSNVRENVQIVKVATVDETVQMSMPSWYSHGDNHTSFETGAANYAPYEVYFVNPNDILEESTFVTPDGNTVVRAVIRTNANDSAFLVARSGLYSAYGSQQRLAASDGTKVIYYTQRAQVANPDQGGAASNALVGVETVTNWAAQVSFSNQYGSCSSNCIRLVTQPGYDPRTEVLRDQLKALAPVKDKLEISRTARHTAIEDQIAPGSGPVSQILSGGNMQLTVSNTLDNRYGDIKARGVLNIGGGAAIRNEGATLYRTHAFSGTWRTAAGDVTAYNHASISEVVGTAAGKIEGGQGVSITGRSFSNVDVTAGTVGNIRDAVQVIGSGQSGAASAGGRAVTAGSGGVVSASVNAAGTGPALAAAVAASNGGGLAALGNAGASGVRNLLAAGGTSGASGQGNDARASADAAAGVDANSLGVNGAAGASGQLNNGRLDQETASAAGRIGVGNVRSNAGASAGQGANAVQGAAIGTVRQVSPGGLAIRNPDASGNYVFETRPQFANQGQWTSSDYLLNQLGMDPTRTHKRLGDGYYEQRLVREQLSELTGRAPQAGASDDSIYKALLNNAASVAHEFNLRPGVALSAEQVSRLTSDIVWMVSENVQLPDGSVETVLVPKVYVAHVGKGAVRAGGALVTGDGVSINVTESIANLGGVIDGGNGRTVLVAGQDIVNRGGSIAGGSVGLQAGRDVRNESLVVNERWSTPQNGGSTTALSNAASIVATGKLGIAAGRDLIDLGGTLAAGSAVITAGNDIRFDTIKTGSTYQSQISGYTENNSSVTHQLSQINIGGDLAMKAGGNLNLTGTQVSIGASGKGSGQLVAGGDVTIASVVNEVKTSQYNDPASKTYDRQVHAHQSVVGADVSASGNLAVSAGTGGAGSVNILASTLSAGNALQVMAADNVNVVSAQERHLTDTAINRTSSSALRSTTTRQADYVESSLAVGSSLSGKTIDVIAGKDINVRGSAIAGDGNVDLSAGGSVNIVAATSTVTEKHHKEVKESGFLSGGGFGISYGERTTTIDQSRDATTQSGQSRSMVGSIGGNLSVTAGDAIKVSGSDLHAGGNMLLDGRNVTVDTGRDDVRDKFEQSMVQDGLTLAVGGSVVGALQTMLTMKDAASQSKDGRVQALAAATAALAAKNAASDIAKNGVNVNVSLTVGHSESHSSTTSDNLSHQGGTLNAGKDITIRATGGGADSNINIVGSNINAAGNIKLKADNDVNLVAAQDKESQHTDSRSMSASAGIGASIGSNGTSIGITASASMGKGKEDGKGTTQLNTHVTAGNQLSIESGGDTSIKGGVVSGKQVIAQVGGDLNIESLQDTATFASKNQSVSVSGTFGAGVSVSGSFNNSKLSSDYASVQEQSGIRAGEGGFQLVVKGNTDLKGGVISSTQGAIDAGKNSLSTGTLTVSDIANHADYKGQSIGLSGGLGGKGDSRDKAPNTAGVAGDSWQLMQTGGSGMNAPVAMNASGSKSSITSSGISGASVSITDELKQIALSGKGAGEMLSGVKRDITNETNTSGAIKPIFDRSQIEAAFAVAGGLGQQVGMLLQSNAKDADDLLGRAKELENKAGDPQTSDGERLALLNQANALRTDATDLATKWGPGGTYRQIATALSAAASGNVTGSAAQFGQDLVVNYVQQHGATLIGTLVEQGKLKEGSPLHAALHGVVACAGSAASSQGCAAGAVGASASSLLTNLFAEATPDQSKSEIESKRNLVATLVAGIAVSGDVAASSAVNGAVAATDNNWLATQQIVQMKKELASAKGSLDELKVLGKWALIDKRQDVLTVSGVGKGLAEAGWSDIKGLAELLANPMESLEGLKALVNDPEVLEKFGAAAVESIDKKINTIQTALRVGGDQNAELLGKNIGEVIWQVAGIASGVGGVTKATATLGAVGVKIGKEALESVAGVGKIDNLLAAGGVFKNGTPLMDFRALTNAQKDVIGSMLGSERISSIIPSAERIGRVPLEGQQGIDDLFKIKSKDADYVVVEYKFGSSKQGTPIDGLQGSDDWLFGSATGNNRVLASLKGNIAEYSAFENSFELGRVEKWLVHTDPYGKVTVATIGPDGKLMPASAEMSKLLTGKK